MNAVNPTSWWWVRHAPVTSHVGRIYGSDDVACDTSDREVFRRLAGMLPRNAVWVTSQLQRTHQTAQAIADHLPADAAPEPVAVEAFGEQSFGDWHGLTHAELNESRNGAWHRFWLAPAHETPPGGESFLDVIERVSDAVTRLSEQHRGRDIVAVTHGGTIRAALGHALGIDAEQALAFEVANCAVTRLDHFPGSPGSHAPERDGSWRVSLVNSTVRTFD